MSVTFQSLGLEPELIAVLSRQGITTPFPIQADAIPDTLSGRDIQGRAPTGSGKTLAFGLPLLSQIGRGTQRLPRALILVPTRELAEQIRRDLEPLARAVDRAREYWLRAATPTSAVLMRAERDEDEAASAAGRPAARRLPRRD